MMTGVLLIPLWRGARFWLHAFPDGRHLRGAFKSFRQLMARTRSWGLSPKDAFAGKWVVFLALEMTAGEMAVHWNLWYCRAAVSGAYLDMIVCVENEHVSCVKNIDYNKKYSCLYQESIIPALPFQACFLHGYVA